MTTIRLAQRLARRTKWLSLHAVPIAELDELVMCLNQACADWYSNVAHVQKSGILTEILHEPASLTVSILDGAKGFSVLGTTPEFLVADMTQAIGCTVIVGDDPKWNTLLTESTLALPYAGSGGSQSMRVLFNALHLGEDDIQLAGQVEVTKTTDKQRFQLTKRTRDEIASRWNGNETGIPQHYEVIPIETWEAGDPRFAIRVYPAPATDIVIETSVQRRPIAFSVTDLIPPGRAIPIAAYEIDNIILPMAAAKLLPAGLLDVTRFDARAVTQEGDAALQRCKAVTAHIDPFPNWIGTPTGF